MKSNTEQKDGETNSEHQSESLSDKLLVLSAEKSNNMLHVEEDQHRPLLDTIHFHQGHFIVEFVPIKKKQQK